MFLPSVLVFIHSYTTGTAQQKKLMTDLTSPTHGPTEQYNETWSMIVQATLCMLAHRGIHHIVHKDDDWWTAFQTILPSVAPSASQGVNYRLMWYDPDGHTLWVITDRTNIGLPQIRSVMDSEPVQTGHVLHLQVVTRSPVNGQQQYHTRFCVHTRKNMCYFCRASYYRVMTSNHCQVTRSGGLHRYFGR